jgi:uncharacterized protein DUF5667/uncharacterized protein DUF5666
MNNYEILEVCLHELENGADLELLLKRYPDQADELRPILMASMGAKSMAVPAPSPEMIRRNRVKLLYRAAQLREQEKKSFTWLPTLRRIGTSLAVLFVLLFTGTQLVGASSTSLPGDQLYPVKRSWENVTLFFTFDPQARGALEVEYENERLNELQEVFSSGRSAKVEFAGIITRENGNGWWIDKVLVIISPQTQMPSQSIQVGVAVQVHGVTQGNGMVLADKVEVLPNGAALPEVEHEQETETETEEPSATPTTIETAAAPTSETETPRTQVIINTLMPTFTLQIESFTGTLLSIKQDTWKIGNTIVNVDNAEIKGVPYIGASVKAEGYFNADGTFAAVKIEILSSGSGSANQNTNNNHDNGNSGSNMNSGHDDNNNSNSGSGSDDHGGDNGNGN